MGARKKECVICKREMDYGEPEIRCSRCRKVLSRLEFLKTVAKGKRKFNMSTTGDEELDRKAKYF